MHDMLQEMGKSVVINESLNEPGKRSRLWLQNDIDDVLTKNKGTKDIQSIAMNLLPSRRYKACWDPKAFLKMCNLKLLMLENIDLPLGLNCLSEGLRYIEWIEFPLKELPLGEQLDNLVELIMHHSKIQQLWHGTKFFGKLKLIDLKGSRDLIRFPCVDGIPCLQQLVLEGCENLVEVHQSVGLHKKLVVLNLRYCVNLKILPRKLDMDSLKEFILSGCSKVRKLPEFGDNMRFLSMLDLRDCKNLVCLPYSIYKLKSLKTLNTSGCSKFSRLPDNLAENEVLEEINVKGTAIREIPSSIVQLKYLKKLSFGGHQASESNWWNLAFPFEWKLQKNSVSSGMNMMFPPLSRFYLLEELDLSYCNLNDESLPLDLGCLSSLKKLDLSGNNFATLPTSCIANLSKLYSLNLDCCQRLESVPMLPPHVDRLYGRNCASWQPFSDPQELCDYFASHQPMRFRYEPFLIIPGREIPSWFCNQDYFNMEISKPFQWEIVIKSSIASRKTVSPSECDTLISILVDIPDYCLSSEWWGIVVCLVLENQFPPSRWWIALLHWICKTPGAELPISSGALHGGWIEEFRNTHLCIFLLRGDDQNIQRHLRGDHNQLQLLFYVEPISEDDEADDPGFLNISKCGCRVLCTDDLEVWGQAMSERKQGNNIEMPSSSPNKSRVRENIVDDNQCAEGFEGEYANTSNAEVKRRKLG
ncbi:hypothetical protein L6164_028800 [Bauhinia variegata]|uniref:Uncharacterized protein n=1 Tax=Bauhinia variegata TaxID=167791 RepID=A0ACB9L6X1_BAUVA|nr:hypothetical protein L6164_028800 [Bauhinia variegata]